MKSELTLTNSFILGLFGLVWNGIEMVWNGFKWNLHIVLQILSFWAYLVRIEMKLKWIEMNLNLICILRSKYSSSKEFIKETSPQGRRVGFRVKFLYVNHLKFISNRFKSFQTVMLLKVESFLVSRVVGDIRMGPARGPLAVVRKLKWNWNGLKWIYMKSTQRLAFSVNFG